MLSTASHSDEFHLAEKGGQLLGKLISKKQEGGGRKREMTQLPKVITFSLFISLFICGCVQTELIIELPERKCLCWNPITSGPSPVAELVNMRKCTAPDK